ncbi:MAG: membrane-associated Zn-dependent protease [Chlorobi bacterium OLB5]|nr:MAG: membrane-associated Zn-dependent protease [Chlorobi bacterium OLB5]
MNLQENEYNGITGSDIFDKLTAKPVKKKQRYWINIVLFFASFITAAMGGVYWLGRDPYDISNFHLGLTYASLIILFLSFHEFGHYFAAKYHKIDVTLPYYIPVPLPDLINPFGTMGAVIKIKEHIKTRKALFDIGIAGPIAGFVIASASLIYGFLTLPGVEYIYAIHPEYIVNGMPPVSGLTFANTLLYSFLKSVLPVPHDAFIPPMNEIYHYPFLCAGWFGLFVTSLNLMPIGQLDGGHIVYALFRNKHKYITRFFFGLLIIMSVIGILNYAEVLNYPELGSPMWIIWVILLFFVIKIDHPPFYDPAPLGFGRKMLGIFAFIMFICSFTPAPIKDF